MITLNHRNVFFSILMKIIQYNARFEHKYIDPKLIRPTAHDLTGVLRVLYHLYELVVPLVYYLIILFRFSVCIYRLATKST